MHNISLIDETLDKNLTANYNLSIQVSLDGFSFCIKDLIRNKYIVLKHIDFSDDEVSYASLFDKINECFNNEELLNKTYKSSQFCFVTQKSTLVPASLYQAENSNNIYNFSLELEKYEQINSDYLSSINSYNIYSINSDIYNLLKINHPNIKISHQASSFIEMLFANYKNKLKQKAIFINVNPLFFDVAIINQNDLLLYNTFKHKNEKDFIYFIMYIFEQLKLNPENDEVILMGDILENSNYHNILKKYIRQVRFEKPTSDQIFSYTFNSIASHIFLNLFNLNKCE